MSRRYLRSIDVERYGALERRSVGPFGPGLNVVFGPNEAGKSTVASFVGGVLFGWEEAHGVRNTYRPAEGERSGSLVFASSDADADAVVFRERNEDGLGGDVSIVADIDNNTFKTMFSLTSDELRSLRNSSDVTARLLTAGSGTGTSPAAAYVEVEQRIAALTSRSAQASGSIPNIVDKIDQLKAAVKQAEEVVDDVKRERFEQRELRQSLDSATERLDALNREIDSLASLRAKIERIDAGVEERSSEVDGLVSEKAELSANLGDASGVDPRLLALGSSDERAILDELDEFAEEQAKLSRAIDAARENSAASSAAYEALLEIDDNPSAARSLANRTTQAAVSVVLPIAFVVAGAFTFLHGREIESLSFTALGIGLVAAALILAAAAIVVLLRPSKGAEAREGRKRDAQWVMLQDRKKLDASLEAKAELELRLGSFLDEAGLGAANGSVRQARVLMDEARTARARREAQGLRLAALDMHLDEARKALKDFAAERRRAEAEAGVRSASLAEIDGLVAEKTEERNALIEVVRDMSVRLGELGERLARAEHDRSYDQLKLSLQQERTKLKDAKHELIALLLAKRMLDKSIVAWESRSQPEVYREASRLMSLVTGGAWVGVSMTREGRLVATSSDGAAREVRHLSLGTCQQLYLSLRIAMLLHSAGVGKSVPVLADDILVNFDAARRRGAARALAKLAERRQVIVFTCHHETVDAIAQAADDFTYLEL